MNEDAQRWRVLGIELRLDEPESLLLERAAARVGVDAAQVRRCKIARKSVDARRQGGRRRLRFVVHVDLTLAAGAGGETLRSAVHSGRVIPTPPVESFLCEPASRRTGNALVVGAGPAGLYAAHVLSLNGVGVSLIDRGVDLGRRGRDLVRFRRTRVPDSESNLLFGEGGAGTYSDGKLYTRVDDPLEASCLELLVAAGAGEEILYDSRAHIGTDRLHRIIPALRRRLVDAGVHFHWGTRLEGLRLSPGSRRVVAACTSRGELPCDALFVAPGHSARDTWRMLQAAGVQMRAKPFQLGVRIEHPQELIDRGRYGTGPEARSLGPAYYNLVCSGRPSTYSFCMCPGGKIVASVNQPGVLCTNGMSNSMHSSPWANAAVVTTLGPDDFGDRPFAGVELQEELERRFFEAGGGDYTAPAQRADDFLAGRLTDRPRRSSYAFGTTPGRIDRLLPPAVAEAVARGLRRFDRQLSGFAGPEGLLVGIETRSSGPVRLPRGRETSLAEGFDNLYPLGEGAGHAGGIMSSAIDGARAAKRYCAG
jgi:uncharacterized FAD-dependent dehydrogenase